MSKVAPDGSLYLLLDTAGRGLLTPDGALRGTTHVDTLGLYHPDGSYYVVIDDIDETGSTHSSGARRVSEEAGRGSYSSTGALRVTLVV